jgi:hypothetical protein
MEFPRLIWIWLAGAASSVVAVTLVKRLSKIDSQKERFSFSRRPDPLISAQFT